MKWTSEQVGELDRMMDLLAAHSKIAEAAAILGRDNKELLALALVTMALKRIEKRADAIAASLEANRQD